jgi:hypothetical protein
VGRGLLNLDSVAVWGVQACHGLPTLCRRVQPHLRVHGPGHDAGVVRLRQEAHPKDVPRVPRLERVPDEFCSALQPTGHNNKIFRFRSATRNSLDGDTRMRARVRIHLRPVGFVDQMQHCVSSETEASTRPCSFQASLLTHPSCSSSSCRSSKRLTNASCPTSSLRMLDAPPMPRRRRSSTCAFRCRYVRMMMVGEKECCRNWCEQQLRGIHWRKVQGAAGSRQARRLQHHVRMADGAQSRLETSGMLITTSKLFHLMRHNLSLPSTDKHIRIEAVGRLLHHTKIGCTAVSDQPSATTPRL